MDLLNFTLQMHQDLEQLRAKYMLDAEALFDEIDQYKQGWISHGSFRRWVQQNCYFTLSESDMQVLQPLLDDARDGQITRDEFIAAFGAPREQEELDHEAAEQEHNEALKKKEQEEAAKAKADEK